MSETYEGARGGTVLRTRGRDPAVRPLDPQTVSVQRDRGRIFWSAVVDGRPASERYEVAAEPVRAAR